MDEAKLSASLILHEGLRLFPYQDTAGKLTIGVGRNLTDRGISHDEALYLLGNDIHACILQAEAEPWWPAVADDDVRSRATLEILFNLGLAGMRQFPIALAALERRDFSGAAEGFKQSVWFHQVGGNPGQRGFVLTEMIRMGKDPAQ